MCHFDDFFNHVEDKRACLKIHVELLKEPEDVLSWLEDSKLKIVNLIARTKSFFGLPTLVNPPLGVNGKVLSPLSISMNRARKVCVDYDITALVIMCRVNGST